MYSHWFGSGGDQSLTAAMGHNFCTRIWIPELFWEQVDPKSKRLCRAIHLQFKATFYEQSIEELPAPEPELGRSVPVIVARY